MTSDIYRSAQSPNPLIGLSPAKQNEMLQALLNEAAAAQNYELEQKTVRVYSQLRELELSLDADKADTSYLALHQAWIHWLCEWENFSRNLMHRRRLIGYLNQTLGQNRFSLEIYPYATRLYSIDPSGVKTVIRLHECMDHMTDVYCRKFAQCIRNRRWKELNGLIREYQEQTPESVNISTLFRETKVRQAPKNRTKGVWYDLEEVFNTCNSRWFGGKMPRPAGLFWSDQVNHSTMGSYNVNKDALMINRGLDRRDVPAYVLDFIMYHELLHKLLGVKTSGTRRVAHTPEFRRLEKAHPDYERAQAFIRKNARKL